jgi:hypothetical protein
MVFRMRFALNPLLAALAAGGLLAVSVRASAPVLEGLPNDRAALGDAFVEAWLAFRDDVDAAPHAEVHPALLRAWFSAAPRFLSRDAARISSNPQVVLAAGSRLAEGARDEDRRLLREIERRHRDSPLFADLLGLRIAAKDRDALNEALGLLGDPEPLVALEGARALAAAGDGRGLEHLRRALERRDRASGAAARALGRYGAEADMARLEAARARGARDESMDVGIGELALRLYFPLYDEMLARRDPSGVRFGVERGLYDTWLAAIGRAAAAGARDSKSLLAAVERERAAAQGWDGEPKRRELGSLIDFWSYVDTSIRVMASAIAWPGDFLEAERRLRYADPGEPLPERFSRRFAAAIAVLSAVGPELDYERLAPPTEAVRFLSPGGDRAADGNFATSWRGGEGAELVLDVAEGARVSRLWIAVGCAGSPGGSVRAVRVSGPSDGPWSIAHRFAGSSRYFEEVPLGAPRAGRITVTMAETTARIGCVAELRAE